MSCKCVPCKECGGSGNVWIAFGGKYNELCTYKCPALLYLEQAEKEERC